MQKIFDLEAKMLYDINRQEKINFSDKESIYEKIQNHEN